MNRFQAGLHRLILKQIEPGQRILDAGCGTGNLTLKLAAQAREVVGVDLSPAMIETAQERLRHSELDNVRFLEADLTQALAGETDHVFDLALSVMVVHEMPTQVRLDALREMARLARRVFIVDFETPQRWNLAGLRNRTFEMLAGATHYRAFRDYRARGGMPRIAKTAGLSCEKSRSVDSKTLGFFWLSLPST